MEPKAIDTSVSELVEYLRSTGTGTDKLQAITSLGRSCKSTKEFMDELRKVVGLTTLTKITDYLSNHTDCKPCYCPEDKKATAPSASAALDKEEETTTEDDAVLNMNAADAIDSISRMRSVEKLEAIVVNDKRKTVIDAANKRLAELQEAANVEGNKEGQE